MYLCLPYLSEPTLCAASFTGHCHQAVLPSKVIRLKLCLCLPLSYHRWGSEHPHCLSSAPHILTLCSISAQLRAAQHEGGVPLIRGCTFSRNICHLLMLGPLSSANSSLSQYLGFCLWSVNLCCFWWWHFHIICNFCFLCSLIWLNMRFLVCSCCFLSLSYMVFLRKGRNILKQVLSSCSCWKLLIFS